MAQLYFAGKIIEGERHHYEVIRQISYGEFAITYQVKSTTTEEIFFLKQYKSPVPRTFWYSEYVEYQKKLLQRIDNDFLRLRTLKIIDYFGIVLG